jgi:osmotically-inducible protein OsmY
MDKIVNEFSKKLQKMIQESDIFKEEWNIEVFEDDGVVTLTGTVPSKNVLEQVESIAQKQKGVKAVINEMDIDESLSEGDEEFEIDKEDYVPPIRNHPG